MATPSKGIQQKRDYGGFEEWLKSTSAKRLIAYAESMKDDLDLLQLPKEYYKTLRPFTSYARHIHDSRPMLLAYLWLHFHAEALGLTQEEVLNVFRYEFLERFSGGTYQMDYRMAIETWQRLLYHGHKDWRCFQTYSRETDPIVWLIAGVLEKRKMQVGKE